MNERISKGTSIAILAREEQAGGATMKPFYQDNFRTIYNGDCLEVLKELPDESIDEIVTDPPYQLSSTSRARPDQTATGSYGREVPFSRQQSRIKGFMGKEWDVLPPVEVWRECLRVLKPGAFAFVMTTPRQDSLCQILMDLSQAGFQMSFSSIYWVYGQGFPKAQNVAKIVDKRLGVEREVVGKVAGMGKQNPEWNGTAQGRKDNSFRPEYNATIATSPQAKALDGSYAGAQFKPAIECILVVMRPLSEKTYVDQALKNRKGITWLKDCMMPYESEGDKTEQGTKNPHTVKAANAVYGDYSMCKEPWKQPQGRFPANLICSEDALNDGRNYKTGSLTGNLSKAGADNSYGDYQPSEHWHKGDSGSFSRYFDLDRWWAKRIKELPASVQKTFPFLIVPKASKSEKNKGCENVTGELGHNRFDQCAKCGGYILQNPDRPSACKCESPVRTHNKVKGNIHPTCKPVRLMSFLVTLGSRPGDVVLDPFFGSGTTAIACRVLGRKCIGIEISEEYCQIAVKRQSDIQLKME